MHELTVRLRRVAAIILPAVLVAACATVPPSTVPSAGSGAAGKEAGAVSAKTPDKPAAARTKAEEAPSTVNSGSSRDASGPASLPDTYLVQPGDTLALIARRPEIYGDSSMWMMLFRANAGQIPNIDWLCPGQVLAVPRSYTDADAQQARQEVLRRTPWPPDAKAKSGYTCKGLPHRTERGSAAVPGKAATPATGAALDAVLSRDRLADVRNAPAVAPATDSPVTVGTAADSYRDAARRAFNMRDIPWAIYYYRAHLTKSPQDMDALGELGNIYYHAGNLPMAAALFYDAAGLLLEKGQRAAASRLLLAISEGNPALADDLYSRLLTAVQR